MPDRHQHRIVVITGARQTGKTTLARLCYPELRYINLDSVEERETIRSMRTASWSTRVGDAILDEAQKEPGLFDKLKYAFDEGSVGFTVLTGSSRIPLLHKITETLAGRAFLFNLWPLMLSELRTAAGAPAPSILLDRLVESRGPIGRILADEPPLLFATDEEPMLASFDHAARWGGMPALLDLGDGDRQEWLRSFSQTYLERDLADLVRLQDLGPFRTLQQLAMLRSGRLLSYAELARDAKIGATTARRYLEYLSLTYQVILLQPYGRNLTSAAVKTPKLYWTDLGLLRQGTGRWGPLDGAMFETLVVVEIAKWIDTVGRDAALSFYRTRSGLEVDLIIETPAGVIGMEAKAGPALSPRDLRALRSVAQALGEKWLGGMVVYGGRELKLVERDSGLWAVPVHRLL